MQKISKCVTLGILWTLLHPFHVHEVLRVKQFKISIFVLMNRIREITARVAAAVLKEAVKEDLAAGYRHVDIEELQQMIQDDVSN